MSLKEWGREQQLFALVFWQHFGGEVQEARHLQSNCLAGGFTTPGRFPLNKTLAEISFFWADDLAIDTINKKTADNSEKPFPTTTDVGKQQFLPPPVWMVYRRLPVHKGRNGRSRD